jgi:hypothetical protein
MHFVCKKHYSYNYHINKWYFATQKQLLTQLLTFLFFIFL